MGPSFLLQVVFCVYGWFNVKMWFPCLAKILPNPIPYHPWDWYIYLHLVDFYGFHVGKYTSPMDGMGIGVFQIPALIVLQFDIYKDL